MRLIVILGLFFISILILIFASLFVLIKRHSKSKDSKFLTNLKVFLGIEQDKDSISEYFNNADSILKYFLKNSHDYKYDLPWYISFGSSNSGKTSFFANVDLETPIQLDYNDTSYINHYFFNQGIVLDLKSELIFNDSKQDFCWSRLIKRLKTVRPMKPLDGILYFVSLKELLSEDPEVILEFKKNIEKLYHKLWKLQDSFEMSLPVYMVFTHLDCINGFSDFIEKFSKYKNDIFGWSNPFNINVPFNDDWIENFKSTLDFELKNLLSEVMVNFDSEDSFNMMNFINNFQDIYSNIAEHLSITFKNNKYTKGLFLRGVYFTALDTKSTSYEKLPYLTQNEDVEVDGGNLIASSNLFFAHDLLCNKIFPEKEIGQDAIDKKLVSKKLKVLKSVYAISLIAGVSYAFHLNKNLMFFNEVLYPKTLKLTEVLKDYNADKNYVNRKDFSEELKIILQYIGELSSYKLRCKGIPSSLFSSLERSKTNLILLVTKNIVVSTLFDNVEYKLRALSQEKHKNTDVLEKESFLNPLYCKEFNHLSKFVKKVSDIEQYEQKFICFKQYHSFSAFSWLLENILNVKMPKSFEQSVVFSEKLDLNDFDVAKFFAYKKNIKKRFRVLVNKFIVRCFSKDRINLYFSSFQNLLHLIEIEDKNLDYDYLKNLQKYTADLVDTFNSSSFDWLKSASFGSDELEILLKNIESSILLGGEDTVNEIINRTTTSFYSFKKTLGSYQLPLIGSPFYISNDVIHLSNAVLDLQGSLNDIFSESFMEKVVHINLPIINSAQSIIWNPADVKNVLDIINDYKKFEDKPISSKLELSIKRIAKKNLSRLLKYKLLQSNEVITLDSNHVHLSEVGKNAKNTVDDLYKIFDFISKIDVNLFKSLTRLQYDSLSNFLVYIDRAMQLENLYDIKEDMFLLDSKNKKLRFHFNIRDYLSSQKKQLEFFVLNLAHSVLLGLDHLHQFNDIMPDSLFVKWSKIRKDLDDYKVNPANSVLYSLEELSFKIQTSPLRELFNRDLKNVESNLNKESFFDTKLFILYQRLNNVLDLSISRLLIEQYDSAILFYNEYSGSFPFNINGSLMGLSGYNKMQGLIDQQKEVVELIKLIKPNYDSSIFRFIENLSRINILVSFLMNNDECLVISFKDHQPIGDVYEKNLNLVVSCEAKINGQKSLNLYSPGQLKIYDLIEFEVILSNRADKKISKVIADNVVISKNVIKFNFNKQTFIKFLIENTCEINNKSFIRFTIDIEDDKGIKDNVVIMIPIELFFGGVKFKMPDKAFTKIIEENKNEEN